MTNPAPRDGQTPQLIEPLKSAIFPLLGYGQNVGQVTPYDRTVVIKAHTAGNNDLGVLVAGVSGPVVHVMAGSAKGAGKFSAYPTTTTAAPRTWASISNLSGRSYPGSLGGPPMLSFLATS